MFLLYRDFGQGEEAVEQSAEQAARAAALQLEYLGSAE
jgi:hypothetical protein